jgi:hypothetical protein
MLPCAIPFSPPIETLFVSVSTTRKAASIRRNKLGSELQQARTTKEFKTKVKQSHHKYTTYKGDREHA